MTEPLEEPDLDVPPQAARPDRISGRRGLGERPVHVQPDDVGVTAIGRRCDGRWLRWPLRRRLGRRLPLIALLPDVDAQADVRGAGADDRLDEIRRDALLPQ